jgi:hypothetical protein
MNESQKQQFKQILDQIEFLDWRLSDYIDPEYYDQIDEDSPFESLIDFLDYRDAFEDNNIKKYSKAMKFLDEYDDSLELSLYIAHRDGYGVLDLDSVTLANLLLVDMRRDLMKDYQQDIEEFFYEIQNNNNIKYKEIN